MTLHSHPITGFIPVQFCGFLDLLVALHYTRRDAQEIVA